MHASQVHAEPLAVRFANTYVAVRGQPRDLIDTVESLREWLKSNLGGRSEGEPARADAVKAEVTGVPGADVAGLDVTAPDVAAFRELRDAIRELMSGRGEPALLNRVNQASPLAPAWPVLVADGPAFRVMSRSDAGWRDRALASIAQDAIALLGGSRRDELRACHAPGCVKFFVKDHPRREWCSTGCGNRARAARHFRRHRNETV